MRKIYFFLLASIFSCTVQASECFNQGYQDAALALAIAQIDAINYKWTAIKKSEPAPEYTLDRGSGSIGCKIILADDSQNTNHTVYFHLGASMVHPRFIDMLFEHQ